jgi:hypothetical protein
MPDSIETENAELLTARDLRREFAARMDALTSGEIEKLVIMRGAEMTAVVIPFERYVEMLKRDV